MLAGQLALIVAATFFGAALYVNVAEQPARLTLDDHSALAEWKPAYKRGFAMQGPLAVVGCLFGLLAWWQSGDWRWLAGAVLLIAIGLLLLTGGWDAITQWLQIHLISDTEVIL